MLTNNAWVCWRFLCFTVCFCIVVACCQTAAAESAHTMVVDGGHVAFPVPDGYIKADRNKHKALINSINTNKQNTSKILAIYVHGNSLFAKTGKGQSFDHIVFSQVGGTQEKPLSQKEFVLLKELYKHDFPVFNPNPEAVRGSIVSALRAYDQKQQVAPIGLMDEGEKHFTMLFTAVGHPSGSTLDNPSYFMTTDISLYDKGLLYSVVFTKPLLGMEDFAAGYGLVKGYVLGMPCYQ